MAEEKTKEEVKGKSADEKLIAAACEAFGIAPKYIFASRIDKVSGAAVIVTYGGSRVRFRAGDKAVPLDQIAVTGINPKPKRKPITGKE
ncbi:MAG: hypothetical protein KKD99_13610 [Proteobacteria bacterium]|nr:hypothetical protein [Pseudomonadota bacterium]